jgi:cytochrome c biogenesis protein CcdA
MIKQFLHHLQENFFTVFIFTTYILLILSAFGLSSSAPQYLHYLDYYVSIYICLFLIWRFNPLRSKYEFTELDRKIAFTSGLFIFTTTALNKYLLDIKHYLI